MTHHLTHKTSVWSACVSKILTDILFYVRDIPQSTRTIREPNLIKWCQWEHLLDQILKGLRVRGAGLKLFMGSIDDLVCQLCIGCSLSLSNNGTKLCVITDIFGLSYSFWLVTSIALAILAIVYLFCQGRFIMNSMEGSQTIPTYVEYENALVFESRHTFRMVQLTFKTLWARQKWKLFDILTLR